MTLLDTAAHVLSRVASHGFRGCLVGGLAVSTRCDPRFTRDVDLVVAVDSDHDAETLGRLLNADGLVVEALLEQDAAGRLAMLRVVDDDNVSIDLLLASSGIEQEIVAASEDLEVVPGLVIPVARTGHLMAMKLLSVAPGRETDSADLGQLAAIADDAEWALARDAVVLIRERGFARGRDLVGDLERLRSLG